MTARRCAACGEVTAGGGATCPRCGRPALRALRSDEARTFARVARDVNEAAAERAVSVRCALEVGAR